MHDWRRQVEQKLGGLTLEPQEESEVIEELAAHLEDTCDALQRRGMSDDEARRRAWSQTGNWHDLRLRILKEKRRSIPMKTRVRQLWAPGFLTLVLSMVFLAVIRKFGLSPQVIGSKAALLYLPWLATLPFLGALATYVSGRAGGSRWTTLLASIFPAVALGGAFLLMFPIGLALEVTIGRSFDFGWVATVLLKDAIGWIVAPGAALLLGGLLAQFVLSAKASSRHVAIV